MSDSWLMIIPVDPRFRPNALRKERAQSVLARLAPEAEEIKVEADSKIIRFFDCGENFETVHCGSCGAQIPVSHWADWMSDDYDAETGFALAGKQLACCGAVASLDNLSYEMPQGFAQFCISAMNPNRGPLSSEEIDELAEAFCEPVRVINRYI